MRDAGRSVAAPHSDHPLAKDRGVDERVTPEDIAEPRKVAGEISYAVMWDESDRALHQRAEIVVHRFEMQALQIRDITGDMERENLARAGFQYLIAAQPTIDYETALCRPVPFADQVVIRAYVPDGDRKSANCRLFFLGKRGEAFELSHESIENVRHVTLPSEAGARSVSQPPAPGKSADDNVTLPHMLARGLNNCALKLK
jgi:hypothetical protein